MEEFDFNESYINNNEEKERNLIRTKSFIEFFPIFKRDSFEPFLFFEGKKFPFISEYSNEEIKFNNIYKYLEFLFVVQIEDYNCKYINKLSEILNTFSETFDFVFTEPKKILNYYDHMNDYCFDYGEDINYQIYKSAIKGQKCLFARVCLVKDGNYTFEYKLFTVDENLLEMNMENFFWSNNIILYILENTLGYFFDVEIDDKEKNDFINENKIDNSKTEFNQNNKENEEKRHQKTFFKKSEEIKLILEEYKKLQDEIYKKIQKAYEKLDEALQAKYKANRAELKAEIIEQKAIIKQQKAKMKSRKEKFKLIQETQKEIIKEQISIQSAQQEIIKEQKTKIKKLETTKKEIQKYIKEIISAKDEKTFEQLKSIINQYKHN